MDTFEAKIGTDGSHILWRRSTSWRKKDPTLIVTNRFLKIFEDHDVAIPQIPLLISQLSLGQLRLESLPFALTSKVLRQTAKLFQIQLAWLEGVTDQIYNRYHCYKDPWRFFEDIKTFKIDEFDLSMVAFCSTAKLDYGGGQGQPIILVLREKCAHLDDKIIYRYRIYDEFDWGYRKSRIQLKAIIRIWEDKVGTPVPIYKVGKRVLREIESGRAVPYRYYRGGQTDPSLEDYSFSTEESAVSKEADELPTVFEYIKAYKLEGKERPNKGISREMARFF